MNRTALVGFLATSLVFVFLAVPSTAFSLDKETVRFDFNSGTTQSQRITFIDNKFTDYKANGLDGVLVQTEETGFFVLEGPSSDVDSAVTNLKKNTLLDDVRTIQEKSVDSATFSDLRSHSETDPRGFADTKSTSNPKRVYVEVEFASGTNSKETIDTYFDKIASDGGLGGVLIEGPQVQFVSVALEGPTDAVDEWVDMMEHDDRFKTVNVVESNDPSTDAFEDLWRHASSDTRKSTN